jgi:hypothetical protein
LGFDQENFKAFSETPCKSALPSGKVKVLGFFGLKQHFPEDPGKPTSNKINDPEDPEDPTPRLHKTQF